MCTCGVCVYVCVCACVYVRACVGGWVRFSSFFPIFFNMSSYLLLLDDNSRRLVAGHPKVCKCIYHHAVEFKFRQNSNIPWR